MSTHSRCCPGRLSAASRPFAAGGPPSCLLRYPMTNQAAGGPPGSPDDNRRHPPAPVSYRAAGLPGTGRNDTPAGTVVAGRGPARRARTRNRCCAS